MLNEGIHLSTFNIQHNKIRISPGRQHSEINYLKSYNSFVKPVSFSKRRIADSRQPSNKALKFWRIKLFHIPFAKRRHRGPGR